MITVLKLPIPQRMKLAKNTLLFSLLVSIVFTLTLWAGSRTFPYAPVFPNLTPPPLFSALCAGMLLLLLFSSFFLQRQRLIIFISLLLSALLVLLDINRLQPWFYVYSCMLLVFVFYNGRVDDSSRFTSYFIFLQIILASVYFFCGMSRLNSNYTNTEFVGIIEPLRGFVSERQFSFFKRLGVVAPYMLMFTGIGLIIAPLRYLAIATALITHALLLVFLFPSLHNHNYALWFSNLSFAALVIILFSGKARQYYFNPGYLFKVPLFYIVIALFIIMPFFNNNGYWPSCLSANFRSGKNKIAEIKVNRELYKKLPLYQKSFCRPVGSVYQLDYGRWCGTELKAECFQGKLVFNSIFGYLQAVERRSVKERQLAIQHP